MKLHSILTTLPGILLAIPASLAAADFEADGIAYDIIDQDAKTLAVTSNHYSGNIVIPSTVEHSGLTYSVTEIEEKAFYECRDMTSVIIPNSIHTIGQYAFEGCSGLTTVTIPNSVTQVGKYPFRACNKLIKSAYPSSIGNPFYSYSYGNYVAHGEAICYPKDEAIFENGCIYGPDKSSVLYVPLDVDGEFPIPDSASEIGEWAFAGCDRLTSVTIAENISAISEGAFYGCSALSEVRFNARNCTTCGSSGNPAFPSTIETLTFGNEVLTIPAYAFHTCAELSSVAIPEGVTEIGEGAFKGCSALSEVRFNAINCTTCGKSDNPAFPSTIEILTFSSEVLTIPTNAFRGCNRLTSVIIPPAVNTIRSNAFKGCSGLKEIYSLSKVPPTCSSYGVFTGVNKDECNLKVPTGTIEAYRSAREWQDFLMIIETEYSAIEEVTTDSNDDHDIYNLQGICIRRNATQADIDALPAGIYIVNGRKVIVN